MTSFSRMFQNSYSDLLLGCVYSNRRRLSDPEIQGDSVDLESAVMRVKKLEKKRVVLSSHFSHPVQGIKKTAVVISKQTASTPHSPESSDLEALELIAAAISQDPFAVTPVNENLPWIPSRAGVIAATTLFDPRRVPMQMQKAPKIRNDKEAEPKPEVKHEKEEFIELKEQENEPAPPPMTRKRSQSAPLEFTTIPSEERTKTPKEQKKRNLGAVEIKGEITNLCRSIGNSSPSSPDTTALSRSNLPALLPAIPKKKLIKYDFYLFL